MYDERTCIPIDNKNALKKKFTKIALIRIEIGEDRKKTPVVELD